MDLAEWLARLKEAEPRLVGAVSESVAGIVTEHLPRLKAYAFDSGGYRAKMEVRLTFDLNGKRPKVEVEGVVVPPQVGTKVEVEL
jgi:hypothetical protein